ncbi:MAG TPA: response regulator [Candidatus Binataceae bacterium]|nr:response regulator [Candidatus Binataceae bacterium]
MRPFPSVSPAGPGADGLNFDLKPTLSDDAWAVLLTRLGIAIILASQPLFIISELRLGGAAEVNPWLLTGFHLFNFAAALAGLGLSWTRGFREHWRAAAFSLCTMLIVSSTVMSVAAGGRHEALFVSLLLIMLGSALLIPWDARWQLRLSTFSVSALLANTMLAHQIDPNLFYHWLGVISAACLSQCATSFGVRFRERTQQYKALRERDLQLGESEEKFRRVFETSSDAIVITRTSDGEIIDVNREFLDRTGYSREEVMSRRPSELDLWDDREQARTLSDAVKAAGFVRNVEGHFRMRSGEPVTALISSVRATINGQECVISAVRDVTELRKTHEALIAAREVALAASEAKSQFLSCMSHEIRTPLNVILGSADLLTDTELGPEQRHYVDRVISNGSNLLELLNGILDLTRVESGQLSLEQAPFNVAELTERVADTLAIRTRKTQVELVVRVASDLPVTLIGDPLRLNQVLTNLVGNALKFTEHGEVVVAIERDTQSRDPGALLFSISDTGIGIPPEKLTSIFSPFAQADSSTTRKYGGSGLGLAIVQRLVQLMGGRVWIESAVGKGSTFHFTARFGVPPGATDAAARIDLGAVRVLIMDRNATCRASARDIFEAHGATVIEAASADEAAEAVARAQRAAQPFELVFADCSRLDAGGFELARRIGTRAGGAAGLTVATVSSYDLSKAFVGMREAGLEHYVVKPLKRADLLAAAADFARRTPPAVEPATGSALATAAAAIDQSAAPSSDQLPASPARAALPAAAPAEAAARPCRILLADDSIDNRLLIRAYLGKTGYGLDEAENGQVAVDKLVGGRYDLVLMDIQMPVMDGFSAVRRIRQWECEHGARRTPIIALTASAFDETIRKAVEAGCDSHLGKPLKRSTLLRVIRETALGDRPNQAAADAA